MMDMWSIRHNPITAFKGNKIIGEEPFEKVFI
jgi:hypothetical protein